MMKKYDIRDIFFITALISMVFTTSVTIIQRETIDDLEDELYNYQTVIDSMQGTTTKIPIDNEGQVNGLVNDIKDHKSVKNTDISYENDKYIITIEFK